MEFLLPIYTVLIQNIPHGYKKNKPSVGGRQRDRQIIISTSCLSAENFKIQRRKGKEKNHQITLESPYYKEYQVGQTESISTCLLNLIPFPSLTHSLFFSQDAFQFFRDDKIFLASDNCILSAWIIFSLLFFHNWLLIILVLRSSSDHQLLAIFLLQPPSLTLFLHKVYHQFLCHCL